MQAETAFLQNIDDINIPSFILWYPSHIDSIIEGLKYICRCYWLLVSNKKSQIYAIDDCLLCNSTMLIQLTFFYIDYYAISNDNICLYLRCSRWLLFGNQPKFEIFNGFSYVDCQSYLLALADLSITQKATIICIYLVMHIPKLRFSEAFNLAVYSCIKRYAVFLLHNLASLLTILLSLILALYNVICIVWTR